MRNGFSNPIWLYLGDEEDKMLATNHNAKCNLNDGLHAFRGYFNVFSGVIYGFLKKGISQS